MTQGDTSKLTTGHGPTEEGLTSRPEVNHPITAQIRALKGETRVSEFARKCGIGESLVRKYLAGAIPSTDNALKIARANGVTLDWLATGEGGRAPSSGQVAESPAAGYSYIPLLDVRARAGATGSIVETEQVLDVLAFKEDWIRRELRSSPGDLRLIYVEGDSMEPDLRAGDIILIDHTDTNARREGVYVVRMDGALLVKQLQRLPGGLVKAISRNPAYEPFTIEVAALEQRKDMAIIGRVVWACRRF